MYVSISLIGVWLLQSATFLSVLKFIYFLPIQFSVSPSSSIHTVMKFILSFSPGFCQPPSAPHTDRRLAFYHDPSNTNYSHVTTNAFLQGCEEGGVQHSVLPEPPERCLQGQEEKVVCAVREHTRGRRLSTNSKNEHKATSNTPAIS